MSRSTTGEPTEYDAQDWYEIEDYLADAFADYGAGEPSNVRISAQIEWSGVVDRAHGGHRTTRLDRLDLSGVRAALADARQGRREAAQARPYESYRARGWQAQLKALTGTDRGSRAADAAGLSPSRRTLLGWLSETQTPSKANQARISQAYESLREAPVTRARERHAEGARRVADALSAAVRERYGAEVRFRNITRLDLS